ncbi:MAG: histone-like protein [Candidatus Helarchaeota archaeon]
MSIEKKHDIKLGSLIVKSTIRKYVNGNGCNISSEVLNKTLNDILKKILDRAIRKAKKENRKTLKPRDLMI